MKESKRLFKKKIKEAAEHRLPPSSPKIGKDRFVTNPEGYAKLPVWGSNESGYQSTHYPVNESGYQGVSPREQINQSLFNSSRVLIGDIIPQENGVEGSFITLRIPDILNQTGYRDLRLTFDQYEQILSQLPEQEVVPERIQRLRRGMNRQIDRSLGLNPPWYFRIARLLLLPIRLLRNLF
jgi:hypothetical protein